MINKEDIDFRYYGDDSDPVFFRGVVCGLYNGRVERRQFFIAKKNPYFKSHGDRLTQEAVIDIIIEINNHDRKRESATTS